jgi:acetolactate synthase I/III small subunit
MPMPNDANREGTGQAVLDLTTHDPMAAVRHVAALLARRAYQLLALTCLPDNDGTGRLLLTVADDGRVDRLTIELAGLPEVASARLRDPAGPGLIGLPGAPLAA